MKKFVSVCLQVIVLLFFLFLFWIALWPLCEYISAKMLEGHKAYVASRNRMSTTANKIISGEPVTIKELSEVGLIRINTLALSQATVVWQSSKDNTDPSQNKLFAVKQYEEFLNFKIQLTPLPPAATPATPTTP